MSNVLYRYFSKEELLQIAAELHVDVNSALPSKTICYKISSLLDGGVPEDLNDATDVTFNFMEKGGWIDEEGNVLEINLATKPQHEEEEEEEEFVIKEKESDVPVKEEVKLPQCYGMEDDRDPACKRCRVQDACRKVRVANRPKCFGLLFNKTEPECQVCIEAPACSAILHKEM